MHADVKLEAASISMLPVEDADVRVRNAVMN